MRQNNRFSLFAQKMLGSYCRLCDAEIEPSVSFCEGCFSDLPRYQDHCDICAIPLPAQQHLCGRCLSQSPAFDRVYSPFLYRAPIIQLVQNFKYQQQLDSAHLLGDLLADHLGKHLKTMPEILIPVPLHWKRLRQRGFNQATELALRVRERTGIPIENRLVVRHKHTKTQTDLKLNQRKSNLDGAFKVRWKKVPKRILIIDDVMTTGATAAELAKCLKRHGAESVEIATLARAERNRM